jgi:hypothetical protein
MAYLAGHVAYLATSTLAPNPVLITTVGKVSAHALLKRAPAAQPDTALAFSFASACCLSVMAYAADKALKAVKPIRVRVAPPVSKAT